MAALVPAFPDCHIDNLVWLDVTLTQLSETYGDSPIPNTSVFKAKDLAMTYLRWLDLTVPLGDAAKVHMDNVMIALATARDEAAIALVSVS